MRSSATLDAMLPTSAGSRWLRAVNSARKALTRAGLGTTTSLFEMLSRFNMNCIYSQSQYEIETKKNVYRPQTDRSDTAKGESVIQSHTSPTKLPMHSNSLVGGIACQQGRKGQIELHLEE